MPCTKTIAPPSQPPSVRRPKPISVSTYAPLLTLPACSSAWPKIAASAKKTVAVTIAIMCVVAVFQSSVPRVIVSQSSRPVSAVGTVKIRPTISAIHQPYAPEFSVMPSTSARRRDGRERVVPIVASVSGGWIGWPGSPRHR